MFGIEMLLKGTGVFNEKFGLNIKIVSAIFVIAEVFFNFGIVLMILGSGVLKVSWKDIRGFKLSNVKLEGRLVYAGFLINRIAALLPWLYILFVSNSKLPPHILFLILTEVTIVVIIGFSIKIPIRSTRNI